MRKLFRFKYEPCKGDCYAWCDHLPQELNKLPTIRRTLTVEMMVKAHDRLCDNPEYSFGIDVNQQEGIFVGHFRTPEGTDVYASKSFEQAVHVLCDMVMQANIPPLSGACQYGDNGAEDLGREILKACTDEEYRKAHHTNCPCKKVA